MTRREARRLIRKYWAAVIFHADRPDSTPDPAFGAAWDKECRRIARRLVSAGRRRASMEEIDDMRGTQP